MRNAIQGEACAIAQLRYNRTMMSPKVYRFNRLATAEHFRLTANAGYAVLLGCDGLFWVPVSNRETGRLIRSGYEMAEVN